MAPEQSTDSVVTTDGSNTDGSSTSKPHQITESVVTTDGSITEAGNTTPTDNSQKYTTTKFPAQDGENTGHQDEDQSVLFIAVGVAVGIVVVVSIVIIGVVIFKKV